VLQRADEGVKRRERLRRRARPTCTSATRDAIRRDSAENVAAFQKAMPKVHVNCTIGATKPLSTAYAMAGFKSDDNAFPKTGALRDVRFEECFANAFAWRSLRSMRLPDAAPFRLPRSRPTLD